MKFTETKLEQAIIDLLEQEKYPHVIGTEINRDLTEVLIKDDLKKFLSIRYAEDHITTSEIESIIRKLQVLSSSDLYESNKAIMKLVSDGFLHKREDRNKKWLCRK